MKKNVSMVFAMSLTNVSVKMVGLETPVMNVLSCPDANMVDAKESQILVNVMTDGLGLYVMCQYVPKVVIKNMAIVIK